MVASSEVGDGFAIRDGVIADVFAKPLIGGLVLMKCPFVGLAHGLDDLEGACLCFANVDVTHDDVWLGWWCLVYLAKKPQR